MFQIKKQILQIQDILSNLIEKSKFFPYSATYNFISISNWGKVSEMKHLFLSGIWVYRYI